VRFQFDDLTFDTDARQVWAGTREVRLSPKAFDLLALLIARRPQAVSKADIRAHLWPDTHVTDSSLPSLMSEVRDGIGDQHRNPRLLRTVHGFGYAFQAAGTGEPAASGPSGWLMGPDTNVALLQGENVLGREGADVVVLNSTTVSRRHARLAIEAAGVWIEDLGSKNGTYVNDQLITCRSPVEDGDQVRIGSLLFTFRRSQPSASTETQSSRSGTRLRS
jgi:DNA-binding winged helix-turn-helix (wHTH) protein